jgi:hypothetical protein
LPPGRCEEKEKEVEEREEEKEEARFSDAIALGKLRWKMERAAASSFWPLK